MTKREPQYMENGYLHVSIAVAAYIVGRQPSTILKWKKEGHIATNQSGHIVAEDFVKFFAEVRSDEYPAMKKRLEELGRKLVKASVRSDPIRGRGRRRPARIPVLLR